MKKLLIGFVLTIGSFSTFAANINFTHTYLIKGFTVYGTYAQKFSLESARNGATRDLNQN